MFQLVRRAELGLLRRIAARIQGVSGIVVIGDVHGDVRQHAGQAQRLALGWRDLGPHQDPLAWLHWKSRMSLTVLGRDVEMASLRKWATEGRGVRARVLSGEGGTGKTRLAAELAQELRDLQGGGWEAGFAALRKVGTGAEVFRTGTEGTLILLDYPEEHRDATRALLEDLASLETDQRVRVLLLSRRGDELWQPEIDRAGAFGLFDETGLELGPLAEDALFEVFEASAKNLAEKTGNGKPAPVERGAFEDWLRGESVHRRPLYVIAAAIEAALEPGRSVVELTGREVIQALARRELTRLGNESRDAGLPAEAFPRLTALAAIAGGLTTNDIRRLSEADALELGLPAPAETVAAVATTGRLAQAETTRRLPAPNPDLVAAALVVEVLRAEPELAPERLWAAIQGDLEGGLARIGRLAYDAEMTLALSNYRIGDWLETALTGHPERCAAVVASFEEVRLPYGLHQAAPQVWRGLLAAELSDQERARFLNSLAVDLTAAGDASGALSAIEKSVEIRRRLSSSDPDLYDPELAQSLNNLSLRLFDAGDALGALSAIEESVEIRRRLSSSNPARYEPELASSLNNQSVYLSAAGDASGALSASEESIEIYRRASSSNPACYEPDFAQSLNNLSAVLFYARDSAGALGALQESVEIRRRLSSSNPARYEPDLAESLNNLSVYLSAARDSAGALSAIEEAVAINRRLSSSNPARYERDLPSSLNSLSLRLSAAGDASGALSAIEKAVAILRRLSASTPARYEPDLARSVSVLSDRLAGAGQIADALDAAREAWGLIQPYTERWPDGPHGRLGRAIQDHLHRLEERLAGDEPAGGAADSNPTTSG